MTSAATSSPTLHRPEPDLLPHLVDQLARDRPTATYGLWPIASASYAAGFRTITYHQLAHVVNNLAWWILQHVGPPPTRAAAPAANDDDEKEDEQFVLAYVGPNDVRLTALIIAAIKTGYVLFLTSPRNSLAAQKSLFGKLQCKTLITADATLPTTGPLVEAVQARCLTVPSVDELINTPCNPFAYERSFVDGHSDPLLIIHTSGSTGIPKPLIWRQDYMFRHMVGARQPLPAEDEVVSIEQFIWGKRVMVTVPSFHGAGIMQYLLWAIGLGCIPIAPAAVGIVTAQGLVEALKHTPADVAILVPSVVADLAENPELLAYCANAARLKLILYIGGDLPQAVGDLVAKSIPVRCWWGASEVGIPHQLTPAGLGPTDWRYVCFHPCVGAFFDPVSEDTYELVLRPNKSLPQSAFAVKGQESLAEYRTKDIFQPHPTVANAWQWRSRADDIIVLLNGEKTNPVSMEQQITAQNREVVSALVVGTRRFQTALLIEPMQLAEHGKPLSTSEQAALIERIWPSVQEANAVVPAHARVHKSLIAIVDRPMVRAGKGTLQRAINVEQYELEISTLYANADVSADDVHRAEEAHLDSSDAQSVHRFVRDSVRSVLDGAGADLDESTGTFFEHGMDSLMALQLIRRLRRGLHRPDLGLSTIYSNPTLKQLTAAISTASEEILQDSDALLLEPMLKRYRTLLEQIPKAKDGATARQAEPGHSRPLTVVLTGSTGTVGTFLLRALLDQPGIGHIFCLNRSKQGSHAIHEQRLAERGLSVADLDERVTFLQADLANAKLGLGDTAYEGLCAQAGLIIHNAWPVNFNLSLSAFEPQLSGLVNLVRLAAESRHTASLAFISSVSAVAAQQTPDPGSLPAPEKVMALEDAPKMNGYARSKFLSELLCNAASQQLHIPITIVRMGQVAGAVRQSGNSGWNQKEWFPSLFLGSISMGCFPDSLGHQFSTIDWVPADILADVLVDIFTDQTESTADEHRGARVFNVRNPNTTTWNALLPSITGTGHCQAGVVTPSAWVRRLDAIASEDRADGGENPAVRLLDFYRRYLWNLHDQDHTMDAPPMAIERTMACSPALRGLEAVNRGWLERWTKEWTG
ncbi:hypothetical protein BD289DRAFT_440575 [Coniella lustricola]|uniref:Carrier domain-containing protein n=1 Tax=Coniella lustricola TaxID=2025994 RepID=A0A2T3A0K8_9PEZI|nr:hypothetical protein BD289DRAFT_440575 [Coniella lustricola]